MVLDLIHFVQVHTKDINKMFLEPHCNHRSQIRQRVALLNSQNLSTDIIHFWKVPVRPLHFHERPTLAHVFTHQNKPKEGFHCLEKSDKQK